MKYLFQTFFLAALILVAGNQLVRSQQRPADSLNNASVVKLSKAGFKEKTIISLIFARVPNFDLSPDQLIELKRSGVSEKIIMAMLERQQGSESFDESGWDNDSLSSPSANGTGAESSGIFGSSSGQRSKSQSRGSNGSTTGDTVTTGSATVRILKPPAEGEPAKLEKTKSLTNDSIVELVEAGFSEGTIIRRIEQSPVEFDLAAPKIEELRKRRVSDKILSAMKTAMGEESVK